MQRKAKAPMKYFTAGEPMERMAIDIMSNVHRSAKGNTCICVVMDYFTKHVCIIPLPSHCAETVARELVNQVFTILGLPRFLHSDRGTDLLSELFWETCKIFKVDKIATTP